MSERAACELRDMAVQAIDGSRPRKPVGELWPGTIFEAGGKEFFLVSNRGDDVFGAKIEGGVFNQGVSFPQSYPVTVVEDSRAVERVFWEQEG